MGIIKRNRIRHYVDVGGKWARVGMGFSRFDEIKKPEIVERRYFHESGARACVVGYSPEILYELDATLCDAAAELIRGVHRNELSGDDSEVRVLTVDTSVSGRSGAYPAICRSYCVAADECGGEGELIYKGKLVCASPAVRGVFVVQSGVFAQEVD